MVGSSYYTRTARTHLKLGINSGTPEGKVVPTTLVTLTVLIMLQTVDKSSIKKGLDCDYDKRNISITKFITQIFRNG